MVTVRPQWFSEIENLPAWIRALSETRHPSAREGWCYLRAPVHGDQGFRLKATTVSGG
jgi:hypothetical protein